MPRCYWMEIKVIIVDDSQTLRAQVKYHLEGHGFKIVEAVDGIDGYEKISSNRDASIIIVDLNMPGMHGLTLLQKLKDDNICNDVPKFVLTTESDEKSKNTARAIGVAAWFLKPFNPEKLIGACERVLKKGKQTKS